MALLNEQSRQRQQARIQSMLKEGRTEEVHDYLVEGPDYPWTAELFLAFIDRIGKTQQDVLALLVSCLTTDEELRACIKVPGNQALAGVLSGISKQAAALGIHARDIFSFENFQRGQAAQQLQGCKQVR